MKRTSGTIRITTLLDGVDLLVRTARTSGNKRGWQATDRGSRRGFDKVAVTGVVLGFLLLLLVQGGAVHAATITVNTTADELNLNGNCSLREAISAANTDAAVDACAAGSGADTIVVPAGTYTLSIAGAGEDANASGDLDITADLTIIGVGAATTIIDGASLDRVVHIHGVTVEMSGVTIRNGSVPFPPTAGGGGILNTGTLTLTNVTVSGNRGLTSGGGISNGGTLTLDSSTVSGNFLTNFGGGIFNNGTLTVRSSTIGGNTAIIGGGGIFNNGTLTLIDSTLSGNSGNSGGSNTFGPGGGIYNAGGIATLTIITSPSVVTWPASAAASRTMPR